MATGGGYAVDPTVTVVTPLNTLTAPDTWGVIVINTFAATDVSVTVTVVCAGPPPPP